MKQEILSTKRLCKLPPMCSEHRSAVFASQVKRILWLAQSQTGFKGHKIKIWAQWSRSDLQRPAGGTVSPSVLKLSAGRNKNKEKWGASSLLHVSTLGDKVSVLDLHRTGPVSAVNRWAGPSSSFRAWCAWSLSWPRGTVLGRGRSEETVDKSCSPSGCRLSSEQPGRCWRSARGGSARWPFWCESPGLSAGAEQRASAPNTSSLNPPGDRIVCYLFGSFAFNKLFVNAVGPGEQFLLAGVRPEILAGRPKLDVLLAEFRFEEDAEDGLSICVRQNEECVSQIAVCLLVQGGKVMCAPLQHSANAWPSRLCCVTINRMILTFITKQCVKWLGPLVDVINGWSEGGKQEVQMRGIYKMGSPAETIICCLNNNKLT